MVLALIDFSKMLNCSEWLGKLIELVVLAAIAIIVTAIILKIERKFFRSRIQQKKNIQARFTSNIVRWAIIVIAVIWVLVSAEATTNFGKVLFQGTAIIGAVIGLAAQPVIGDLFAGLMLSIHRPFEIGDRIELDNGVRGVVMDITARHIVVRTIDTIDAIIPNSKVNASVITNMSHNTKIRSAHFRFNVAYGTDVEKAMEVIRQAVIDCEHTIPAWKDTEDYGPVYFISYADSSLVMATTIYYQPTVPSEVVISDVNLRVKKGLEAAGIEIPFNYVNVVMKDDDMKEQ